MIPGYNHNVKYKDRIFHVQTEDSGVKNPHIITLLYYGGNILESVKMSYADKLGSANLDAELPNLMQKQHKDVLRGLITGRYDGKIDTRSANAAFLNGPAPINVAEGSQHQASFSVPAGKPKAARAAAEGDAPLPPPVDIAATMIPHGGAAASPLSPGAAPPPGADGSFSTQGSLLDAFAKAIPTLDAETLKKALEQDDDNYVFGGADTKGLGDMMLDFLKTS